MRTFFAIREAVDDPMDGTSEERIQHISELLRDKLGAYVGPYGHCMDGRTTIFAAYAVDLVPHDKIARLLQGTGLTPYYEGEMCDDPLFTS